MTYLLETVPEITTSLPLPMTAIASPGNSCLMCAMSGVRSRRTLTSKVLMAPARSHTNSEMVPGCLPWMSSWVGAVTIASAMSGTVSETRAIGAPTFSTVERPTSRSTSVGASIMAAGAAAGAAAEAANVGAGCCARGAATRMTMIATTSAAVVAGLPFVARRKRRG